MRLQLLGAASAALLLASAPGWADLIHVNVNGQPVRFPYAQPAQINGRVMVPLRGVLERLGANQIVWRPARQEVTVASPDGTTVHLWIGDRTALVNGRRVPLDVPPLILQGTTMVPLRFVGEELGARVDWREATQTAYIATPNERVAGYREQYPVYSPSEQPAPLPEVEEAPLPRERAPREPEMGASYVTAVFPQQGMRAADPRSEIFARFRPGAPIDYHTVRLYLNGRNITPDADITTEGVRYLPIDHLRRGRNDVRLSFRDRSGLLTTEQWYFFAP